MPRLIGVIEEIGRRGEEEVSVEWRIPNFPSLLHGRDDLYWSPEFGIGDGRWWLSICPEREAGNPSPGWVGLDLFRCDGSPAATFRCSAGIRGSGGVEKSREGEKEFSEDDDCYTWDDFCSISDLLEHRARLMPNDTLTVTCVLKRPGAARDACTQTDRYLDAEIFSGVRKSTEKRGGEKALQDFGKFLSSGEKSDVTVQVGDVEFKVHSFVLFARCPALSVSLQHESKEKESRRIVIEDCEPDVFQEFLRHLYTGSVQSITEKNVFGLYRVADKYLMDDLKEQCVEHIQDTLSVHTFCDSMKLALTHGETGLLQNAIDFATRNIRSIVCSVEWQNFIREYPTEANEIYIKSLGPPSGSQ